MILSRRWSEQHKQFTDDEFYEMMAISNTLPGPLVAKMAGYVGYRIGGILGLINALIATILPSILMLILLFNVLFKLNQPSLIQGMMNGVLPVICVMMFMTFLDCLKKVNRSFGKGKAALIIAVAFLAIAVLHIDSSLVICAAIVLALALPVKKKEERA